MIDCKVRTRVDVRRVLRAHQRANPRSLGHGAAFLRKTAQRSIAVRKKKHAPAGHAPYTRGNKRLRKSIIYAVDRGRDMALIGPAYPVVGKAGAVHEHGQTYHGRHYPKRPFMGPTLIKTAPRLPKFWAGSIH